MFELIDRDAGGRIGKFTINGKTITTPNIAIVINPNKMVVKPDELKKEFGCDIIITNSWIIKRSERIREDVIKQGLHKFLNFDGPIYTDSGVFQSYSQGISPDSIDQDEIIDFQHQIGADIITPVDFFTLPTDTPSDVKTKIDKTTKNVLLARSKIKDRFLIAPVQGGRFPEMRAYAAKKLYKSNANVFAIGGIVPLMEQYRFRELCDAILSAKKELPSNIPVHAFGAGHPMVFSLLAAIGCDLFDSAMYALAAERGAYLTNRGTFALSDLQEFPCTCKMCFSAKPESIKKMPERERVEFLTRHNLYVTFAEIRAVRQAIREGGLWELVQERVRAHPALLEAFRFVLQNHGEYLEAIDSISKPTALFYAGEETLMRPELTRAIKMVNNVKRVQSFTIEGLGKVSSGLKGVYPFGQSVGLHLNYVDTQVDPRDIVKDTVDYQYGKGTGKLLGRFEVELSRNTGRIRRVLRGTETLGTIRAHDGFFIPTKIGVNLISENMKKVTIKDRDAVRFIKEGKNVFAKFVYKADKNIIPGEEVAVVSGKHVISFGTAKLSGKEMKEFSRGVAVDTRSTVERMS